VKHVPKAAPLLIALVFAIACEPPVPPLADSAVGSETPGGVVAYIHETAQKELCKDTTQHADRGLGDTTIAFANKNNYYSWCIPEYHDDQRLNDGSGDYGPVAHALASPRIAAYTNHLQFHGSFKNVGIIDIDGYPGPTPGTYADLGLNQRRSCVYLTHSDAGTPKWTGLVVPAATDYQCPTDPPAATGKVLEVMAENSSSAHSDYPPVARFVTEGAKSSSAVSFRCGNSTCVLVPAGFGTMPLSAHNAVAALKSNRTGVIKGWFDDQKLAAAKTASRFGVLGMERASLIPDLKLGTRAVGDYQDRYLPVAKAYFPNTPSKKYFKAGFGKDTTSIELMFKITVLADGKKDSVWFARLTRSDGTKKVKGGEAGTRLVRRTDHSAWLSSMPATARWRWRDSDEDVWVQCGVGCCLVSSDS